LLGAVTGDDRTVSLSASLLRVSDARVLAHASVNVPTDSVTFGVDRLIGMLLSLQAGEEEQRLGSLAQAAPRALQSFLEGEQAYRAGKYELAVARYMNALELDSTFALAGLGVANAAAWLGPSAYGMAANGRAIALAWAAREKLSIRDRAVLIGYAGPSYPEVPPSVVVLRAWQHAVELAPDRAEAWYELGDYLLHWGPILDVPRTTEKSEQSFRRAVELQPNMAGPLAHLIEITADRRDFAAARGFLQMLEAQQPNSDLLIYLRWRLAMAASDDAALQHARAVFNSAPTASLERIVAITTLHDYPQLDAEHAESILQARGHGTFSREVGMVLHDYAAAHGRWQHARELADRFSDVDAKARYDLQTRVLDALYDAGDSAVAERAATELSTLERDPLSAQPELRAAQIQNRCILMQWRLLHRDTTGYGATLRMLKTEQTQMHMPGFTGADAVCTNVLESLEAFAAEPTQLRPRLEQFERLMLQGPPHSDGTAIASARYGNLILARLWRHAGDLQHALRAVQRRPNHWYFGAEFLNGYRAEEARIRAQVVLTPEQPVQPAPARSR
jgi:tetratricopeptide (TPR) repeat protein